LGKKGKRGRGRICKKKGITLGKGKHPRRQIEEKSKDERRIPKEKKKKKKDPADASRGGILMDPVQGKRNSAKERGEFQAVTGEKTPLSKGGEKGGTGKSEGKSAEGKGGTVSGKNRKGERTRNWTRVDMCGGTKKEKCWPKHGGGTVLPTGNERTWK